MPRTMNEKPKVEGRRARLTEDPELEATEGTTRRWKTLRPRKRSDEGGDAQTTTEAMKETTGEGVEPRLLT